MSDQTYRVTFADHGEREGMELQAPSVLHALGKAIRTLQSQGEDMRTPVGKFYVVNVADATDRLGRPL